MFNTFLIEPLYNFLIVIINNTPTADLGIAIIILTVLVRAILFPISRNSIRSQIKMKEIQKPLKEIQEKYKDDRQKMAEEMMKLYKDNNVKPFSSILLLLIQLPIIFALFFIFSREGLPAIDPNLVYSFINIPEYINPKILGLIDVTSKSIPLAFTAAFTQFIQAHIMFKKNEELSKNKDKKDENKIEEMMKNMQTQMKFIMPIMMYFVSLTFGAVLALYFTVSNIFSIFQEIYIKNKLIKESN